ncbi:unnamed protein product [Adineta ricciae]|uniref:Late endosomal/lysosomal adaptor and MAPK and MTOR activator 1 n=1 Tax=Adineta ricciae TaxID=249248 RepID=A0A814CDD7_ADIRI|nr:unnamed protein product [Adineta ricciae]
MGNICPWCCKNSDDTQSNQNDNEDSNITGSQRSIIRSEPTDRTPLLYDSNNHRQNHQPVNAGTFNPTVTIEPPSLITTVDPPPPPPAAYENFTDTKSAKIPSNETADSSMTIIVDRMLPDLIDVGGWGATTHQANTTNTNFNAQNDQLKQILSKSLQSNRVSVLLPDAGVSNLSSLLSSRPISSEICHFVSHTAGELSRLLIDEIKIVHKEDLVVTFE